MRASAAGRAVAALARQLCWVFIALFVIPALADEAGGLSWLQRQVQSGGALATEAGSIALPVQGRSETAAALHLWNIALPAALSAAIAAADGASVEILARKSLAAQFQASATAHLDALAQMQNPDGGFGAASGYASNAQDTAWALTALSAARAAHGDAVNQAAAWLLAAQHADGHWAIAQGDALVPTALAVQALQPYRQTMAVASALAKARNWLLAGRNPEQTWGAAARNAQALLAVLPGLASASSVQAAVAALEAAQQADGSWGGDPYTTALALRALFVSGQPVTDPDLASLQGQLVSEATGLPLADVPVRLRASGKTAVTDAQGRFRFAHLAAGSDTLVAAVPGYLALLAPVHWIKGQEVDLGAIALKALSGANSSTVTITGVASFSNAAGIWQNAANASISVGALSVQTHSSGAYTVANVPPGAIELQAEYAGYQSVYTSLRAQAGEQLRFDPQFVRGMEHSTLTVAVTDQASGSAIASASVALNGIERSTNSKGEAFFATGVVSGDNSVSVSASGHETRIIGFSVQGHQSLTLPVALAATDATAVARTVLQGAVTDAVTLLALEGASVTVAGSGRSVATDAQGRYAIGGAPDFSGLRTVRIEKPGYQSHEQTIAIAQNRTHQFDVPLQPQPVPNQSISMQLTVTDKSTHQPISAATVTLSGSNPQLLQTDSAGQAQATGLNAGPTQIQVSATGYDNVVFSADFSAGNSYHVPVEMSRFVPDMDYSTLRVAVTDQASGSAIASASVALNAIVRSTDAKGEAFFATGVVSGDNSVTVSASGHETRIIGFTVHGHQSLTLPVALAATDAAATARTVLQGAVTDAVTLLALEGASVTVAGSGRSVATDAQGRYAISGAPDFSGERKVIIEKPGYQSHEQTIAIAQNRRHQFDIPLQPLADPSQPISMQLTVIDRTTHQPISAATVTLSGSNSQLLQTNSAGQAQASGLNAGATHIHAAAAGYNDLAFAVDLSAGNSYRIPVEMRQTLAGSDRVHGTVLDAHSRRPISAAQVTLAGNRVLETSTDANGRYEFTQLSPGHWNLSAISPGYKGSSRGFDIAASTEIDIPLNPDYGIRGADSMLRTVAVGHPNYTDDAVGYLFIFGAQGTTGHVVSNDRAMNHSFTIGSTGVAEIMVPKQQFLNPANTVLDKALFVHATNPVSASFLNREQYATDMTYLLDLAALGLEYRILGWQQVLVGYIQMSVTAVEDGTSVSITPASDLASGQKAGAPFSVTLNQGQSVYYRAPNGNDLSGTHIVSSKPVAVFSGGQCVNIPVGIAYCDHLFTQLPPIAHWARNYLVPETANTGSVGNLVRILAHTNGTEISVNGAAPIALNAGQFHQIGSAKDLHIEATHPVLVGQFLKGYDVTSHGDPSFTHISGIDQTLKDYAFTVPVNLARYDDNFLNLAVPTSAITSLELNGQQVDTSAFRQVGNTGYSAGSVALTVGPGRIKANSPFLATISGFSWRDSYHTIIGANYSVGASALDPVIASIAVSTDQPSYPADTPVQLAAQIANQGSAAVDLRIVLRINDSQGSEVVRFAGKALGSIAAKATARHAQPWNTARYPAGAYTLIGTLFDSHGETLGAASTRFDITAGSTGSAPDAPKAALSVATDRAEYRRNDRVRIDKLVRNLTSNAAIDDARVQLTVRDPGGAVVFTHTHALGQLAANAVRALDVQQALRDAPAGSYSVQAVLTGSGKQIKRAAKGAGQTRAADTPVQLASAHTSFVVRNVAPAPAPAPTPGPGGQGGPPTPGSVTGVPVNQPWFLWLLALALLGSAGRRLRSGAAQAGRRRAGAQ